MHQLEIVTSFGSILSQPSAQQKILDFLKTIPNSDEITIVTDKGETAFLTKGMIDTCVFFVKRA